MLHLLFILSEIICILITDGKKVSLGLLIPHSGPRAFGYAVEMTMGMAIEKVGYQTINLAHCQDTFE
jgi:hypothetical protein